jgi:hypothetical protein
MPDTVPNPELLRSLGRLVRGLSSLFWGLPLTLLTCVETVKQTAKTDWLSAYTIFPPLVMTGLLLYGLWQLGSFQKQERPWRKALDRAKLLALINFGLSPFLYWWGRMPDSRFFGTTVILLAVSAVAFLFALNLVLQRLGAMLPDETLRTETRQYTVLNRNLLLALMVLAVTFVAMSQLVPFFFPSLAGSGDVTEFKVRVPSLGVEIDSMWFVWVLGCLLVLLPLAMTMALIWKTKEVILDNVFGGNVPRL